MCPETLFGWCAPLGMTWARLGLLWFLAGFLTAGLVFWFRQVPRNFSATTVMACCLLFWWLVAFMEIVSLLGLVCFLFFNPDGSPLSMLVDLVRATSRHATAPPTPASPPQPAPYS